MSSLSDSLIHSDIILQGYWQSLPCLCLFTNFLLLSATIFLLFLRMLSPTLNFKFFSKLHLIFPAPQFSPSYLRLSIQALIISFRRSELFIDVRTTNYVSFQLFKYSRVQVLLSRILWKWPVLPSLIINSQLQTFHCTFARSNASHTPYKAVLPPFDNYKVVFKNIAQSHQMRKMERLNFAVMHSNYF